MKGLILLLYSIEILGALLCVAGSVTTSPTAVSSTDSSVSATEATSTTASVMSKTSSLISSGSPTAVSQFSSSSATTSGNTLFQVNLKECLLPLFVSGGLIIFCVILLLSTLMLAWKVCQLSSRIKALSSNADLICYSEPLIETAKTDKNKSETGAKETSMEMTDVVQTQEEVGNGTTKEEGGMVNKDGQMGEEKKEKTEEEGASNEEASTTPETVAENSSSSKPQEEAQVTKAVAAPSSQGAEEPKDVV